MDWVYLTANSHGHNYGRTFNTKKEAKAAMFNDISNGRLDNMKMARVYKIYKVPKSSILIARIRTFYKRITDLIKNF